jgi:hypothetical protein
MIRAAVVILGILLSGAATAQTVRLKGYLHPESDTFRQFNKVYLAGAMDALAAYNTAAAVKLFCKEDGIISHQEAARLIQDWARQQTRNQG